MLWPESGAAQKFVVILQVVASILWKQKGLGEGGKCVTVAPTCQKRGCGLSLGSGQYLALCA